MTTFENLGTVDDVRTTLNDIDDQDPVFHQSVIQRSLTAARILAKTWATDEVDTDLATEAVIAVAAKRTFNASPATVQKEAASISKERDLDNYQDHLESEAKKFLAQLESEDVADMFEVL